MKSLWLFLFLFVFVHTFAQTISLNPSFGVNGFASIANKSSGLDLRLESAALQTDGKIVAVGSIVKSATDANKSDFLIVRLNKNGSLDNAFGANGMMSIDISGCADAATCVVVTTDGKIIAAGRAQNQANESSLALVQLNSNGSLDAAFGKGGKLVTKLAEESEATAIAIQKDEKIIVGGFVYTNNSDFLLLRFKNDGSIDKSFGRDGSVTQDFGKGFDLVASIAIQKDGKIIAGGEAGKTFPLVRYNENGQLDKSFGKKGIVAVNKSNPAYLTRYIRGISIQNDGKIVVGGEFGKAGRKTFGVARITVQGAMDNSFGDKGVATTDFGFYSQGVNSIALQTNGKIIAGGMVRKTANAPNRSGVSNDDWDYALARFNPDGKADLSFGNDGKLVTNYIGSAYAVSNNFITKLLLQNDQLFAVGMVVLYENQWGDPVKGSIASYQLKTNCPTNITVDVTSTGFKPYTVYMGYKPASTLELKANISYGSKSPSNNNFSVFWSTGSDLSIVSGPEGKQQALISATGIGNYDSKAKLLVIDKNGCSSEKEYKIRVVDARCGKSKVLVCNVKNATASAVCVAQKDVRALLAKGASLGSCQ